MIELDILDLDSVVEAAKNSDYVYHFAAIADIGEAKKNPYKTLEINLVGTMNILEAAVRCSRKAYLCIHNVCI